MKIQGCRGFMAEETYQSVTVVNGNRSPGDVADVTDEGAVCLQQLAAQYPLRPVAVFRLVAAQSGVGTSHIPKAFHLVVPLHHGARGHQPVVGPQTEVKLLPEGGDVEEKFLLGLSGGKHFALDSLLVSGREQVRQVVSVGVGAEGSDQAVLLQPAPQLVWKNHKDTMRPFTVSRHQENTCKHHYVLLNAKHVQLCVKMIYCSEPCLFTLR